MGGQSWEKRKKNKKTETSGISNTDPDFIHLYSDFIVPLNFNGVGGGYK